MDSGCGGGAELNVSLLDALQNLVWTPVSRSLQAALRPEHEQVIAQTIQSGAYQNPDDVIARALEVLRDEEEWLHDQKTEVAEKIERAFGQFERGEFFSAEESRADMEKRKTTWPNEQKR